MSSVKAIPEGFKWIECEHGIRGKNSLVHYILEQDLMQNALKKSKKIIYFTLILPHTGNELKVTIWASGIPKQLLWHVHTTIHSCKQMGLDANFKEAKVALKYTNLDLDIAKMEYSSKKRKTKEHKEKGDNQLRSPRLCHLPKQLPRPHMKRP